MGFAGSLGLSFFLMALLAAGALAAGSMAGRPVIGVGVVVGLLCLNLLVAMKRSRVFAKAPWMAAFHVSLLALAVSVGAGSLVSFSGGAAVLEGDAFDDSTFMVQKKGWLHGFSMGGEGFVQGPLSVEYLPGSVRAKTKSEVERTKNGVSAGKETVWEGRRMSVGGYAFGVTQNKGFAVRMDWIADNAKWPVPIAVHMPSSPSMAARQFDEFAPPGAVNRRWSGWRAWRGWKGRVKNGS